MYERSKYFGYKFIEEERYFRPLKTRPKLVHCPFNKAHILTDDRLQRHVLKCSVNYPGHYKCPYNALHCFIENKEYMEHILVCKDQVLRTQSSDIPKNCGHVGDPPKHHYVPEDEDDEVWD